MLGGVAMVEARRAIACLGVLCLVMSASFGQDDEGVLESTAPASWELEGRDFHTPDETDDSAPEATGGGVESAEQEAFAARMEAVYRDAPAPADAQADGPGPAALPDMGRLLLNVVFSLCVVVGLILLIGVLARKYAGRTPLLMGQQLGRVVGRVGLGPRAAIHYVHTGGRILVIGVTQNSVTPVAEFEEEAFEGILAGDAQPAAGRPAPENFLQALNAATGKSKPEPSAAASDDELDQLRSDLQRLRHYLREGGRDRES